MIRKRIVVKIGSSSLANDNGGLSLEKIREHVEAIAQLKNEGHEVILISSGAVAAGYKMLGYPNRPVKIAGKQAAAAVGQGLLMQGYTEAFHQHQFVVAQLLLTRDNFSNHDQYANAHATLSELLKRNIIPIINENDSTSIAELTFGDNDMLSALVSGLVHAQFLIILTDINGIYDDNPRSNKFAKKYDYLPMITDDLLLGVGSSSGSKFGTGGMLSKIKAAKTAISLGVPSFIGNGIGNMKLIHILNGQGDGTYIGHRDTKIVNGKKQWLTFHSNIKGCITIDDGAVTAVRNNGKSILPVGVVAVSGSFEPGDVVEVRSMEGKMIGKGQINFTSQNLNKIKGMSSSRIKKELSTTSDEAIHRDSWITYSF